MSTITKERAQEIFLGNGAEPTASEERELARIALPTIEARPVGKVVQIGPALIADFYGLITPGEELYTTPPAPVVPDKITSANAPEVFEIAAEAERLGLRGAYASYAVGWNACRAAMLQGAENAESRCGIQTAPALDSSPKNAESRCSNSPVIPDDVRRMDWLVSKTVDVREPMVYGSHSLFWSQTITDEEDDYHATKLREQIDAAMAAEQAAPQQEVKP